MNDYCRLTFETSDKKSRTVNIPKPDRSLSADGFKAAANKIISGNIFDLKGALLESVKKIELFGINRRLIV